MPPGLSARAYALDDRFELGASRVYLQTVDMTDLDHLDLIARDVLARVR